MRHVTTVIIGAGQSGLAMSKPLTDRSIDHVLIERGEIANSWQTERWDSLRLLTPNWQSRLPGYAYDGRDPNGYQGIAWAIVGKHDRPWFNRPIFGLVRPMSGASTAKKFDSKAYIAQHGASSATLF